METWMPEKNHHALPKKTTLGIEDPSSRVLEKIRVAVPVSQDTFLVSFIFKVSWDLHYQLNLYFANMIYLLIQPRIFKTFYA